MREQHNFSQNYINKKNAILDALDNTYETINFGNRKAVKLIIAVAIISLLTVGVFAATKLVNFGISQDEHGVRIYASLPENSAEDEEYAENKPLRSWNADEDEISVKISFGYMPNDMTEDLTAPYKYSNEDFTRAMTFEGFDLRRCDFDSILTNAESYKAIEVGGNCAYIVYLMGETSFYNRKLYVMFEKEELLVFAYVSYAVTDDELYKIVEHMTVEETDKVDEAMPIGNEFGGSSKEEEKVFYHENPPEYYADLLSLGDTGSYDGYYNSADVTVNSVEYFDCLAGFEYANIIHMDFIKKFVDEHGNLAEYKRTEIIRGDGKTTFNKWGDTVPMTKKFVTVTLTLEYEYKGEREPDKFEDEPSLLHTFSLGGMVVLDDGEVRFRDGSGYVIDSTPGTRAVSHEPVYREYLGDNTWRIGYLIDTDELDGELYFFSEYANIGYKLK